MSLQTCTVHTVEVRAKSHCIVVDTSHIARAIQEVLDELLAKRAAGPSISFTVLDLIRAIEVISVKGPVGRHKLSEELEIGEGAVRTLIKRLKESDLITSSKLGVYMTDKGSRIWRELVSVMRIKVHLQRNELSLSSFDVAVLLKACCEKIKNGLAQRDAAIRVGAKGATTVVFKNGKFKIPGFSTDLSEDFPDVASQLVKTMNPEENDVIIIASGKTLKEAEYGVLAASLTLITSELTPN